MKHNQKKQLRSQLGSKRLFKRRLYKADLWLWAAPLVIALLGVAVWWMLSSFGVGLSRLYLLFVSHVSAITSRSMELPMLILLFIATALYFYIDYQQHARPLKREWPSLAYPLSHHAKVVTLPRIIYNWKRSLFGITYGVVTLLVVSTIVSFSVARASGTLPFVSTASATGISPTAASFNGTATSADSSLTAAGFQYGTSTSYGSTIADTSYQTSTPTFVRQWGSHGTGNGQFTTLIGVATDSSGNVYAVDRDNRNVQKFDSNGNYLTQWGNLGSGDGQFSSPWGLAIDSNNNVYVADGANNRIQKFDSNGNYLTQWGTYGTGPGEFFLPSNLAIDSNNNVYVTENTGGRIQKFDSNGNYLTQWGAFGSGDGEFNGITGMVTDQAGNIFAADNGNSRIQEFDSNGNYLTQWSISGFSPSGLSRDANGNLYTGGVSNAGKVPINKYDSSGNFITSWQITASSGPSAIAISQAGALYLATGGDYSIQQFSSVNDVALHVGTTGLTCNTTYHFRAYATNDAGTAYGSDQSLTTAACVLPSVSTGAAGIIQTDSAYLNGSTSAYGVTQRGFQYGMTTSYGSSVQDSSFFSTSVSYSTKWGSAGSGNSQFNNAAGVTVDSSGNVYVADTSNGRIQKFDSTGAYITQWGTANDEGHLTYPYAIAAGPGGVLYVADSGFHNIFEFDTNGTFITKWGSNGSGDGQFGSPHGIAVDLLGNVYVSESSGMRVQKFSSNGTFITKWGSNGSGDGQFSSPQGVAVDQSGNIYVADSGNNRIQKFNSSGTFITKWGTSGASAGQFNSPWGISVDSTGNVYVADGLNTRIQKFNSSGTYVSQFGSNGTGNGQFRYPTGLATDQYGKVYITETSSSNRIQVFAPTASVSMGYFVTSLTCNTTYHYRAYATNYQGTAFGDDVTFTTADCPPVVQITSSSPLPDVVWTSQQPDSYSQQIETNQPNYPVGFVVIDGGLPPGLTMDDLGLISGNPESTPGTYTFVVYAYYGLSYDMKEFSITIPDPPDLPVLSFTTPSLANLQIGKTYDVSASVKDAVPNQTLVCTLESGQLPEGLTLENGESDQDGNGACRIRGISILGVDRTFTLQVSDGSNAATKDYSIAVESASTGGGGTTTPTTSGGGGSTGGLGSSVASDALPETTPPDASSDTPKEKAKSLAEVAHHSKSSTGYLTTLLARFKITPTQFVSIFPWLIVLLLLLLCLESLVRVIQETFVVKKTRKLVEHQQQLNSEKKSLMALASHYLRTPLTILKGGLELVTLDEDSQRPLVEASQNLQAEVDSLVQQLDQDQELQSIVEPQPGLRQRAKLWQTRVALPVLAAIGLIALTNFVVVRSLAVHPKVSNIVLQLLTVLVLAGLLYLIQQGFSESQRLKKYQKELLNYEEALDRARNQFIHGVTNELVPLVVAVDQAVPANLDEKSGKFIKSGLGQLEATLRDFILIGQLERQALQQHASDLSVKGTVERAVQTASPESLVKVAVPSEEMVRQPEFLVRKVFSSIIDNAIEHSPLHMPTEISSHHHANKLRLEVADHGEGISPEKLSLLFKPLSRVESDNDFTHQGIGLSLYVSRLIAHYLGGEITAKSEVGKGTNMELSIPLQMPS